VVPAALLVRDIAMRKTERFSLGSVGAVPALIVNLVPRYVISDGSAGQLKLD